MPNIPFPYFSIALDAFGLVIMITIFVSCLDELVRKKSGSPYFFLLLLFKTGFCQNLRCQFRTGQLMRCSILILLKSSNIMQ